MNYTCFNFPGSGSKENMFLGLTIKKDAAGQAEGVEVLKPDWTKGWISMNQLNAAKDMVYQNISHSTRSYFNDVTREQPPAGLGFGDRTPWAIFAYMHLKYWDPEKGAWQLASESDWDIALDYAVEKYKKDNL